MHLELEVKSARDNASGVTSMINLVNTNLTRGLPHFIIVVRLYCKTLFTNTATVHPICDGTPHRSIGVLQWGGTLYDYRIEWERSRLQEALQHTSPLSLTALRVQEAHCFSHGASLFALFQRHVLRHPQYSTALTSRSKKNSQKSASSRSIFFFIAFW